MDATNEDAANDNDEDSLQKIPSKKCFTLPCLFNKMATTSWASEQARKKTLQRNRGLQTFALNENDAGTKHLVAARLPVLHLTIV